MSGNPAGSGSAAIRVGNDVNAVQILDNVVRGPFFAGIRVAERADGVLVKRDTVRRAQTGIDVETSIPGGAHVRLNTVADSVSYGVHLHAVASEDLIKENTIGGSGTFDCFDESTGSGSAGTADKWLANTGATSSPAGLCRP